MMVKPSAIKFVFPEKPFTIRFRTNLKMIPQKYRLQKINFPVFFIAVIMLLSLFPGSVKADFWNGWEHPNAGDHFNPQSVEGFQYMRFEGDIYNVPAYIGFFYDTAGEEVVYPNQVELRFIQGDRIKVLDIENPEETVQINEDGGTYLFEVAIPLDLFVQGEDDGEWLPQIHFEVGEPLNYGADLTLEEGIIIDTTPPTVSFSYDPELPTNNPIQVTLICNDGENGSGCYPLNLDSFPVQGNFHPDFYDENRGFQICDRVKNCTDFTAETNKVSIANYDPVSPSFLGIGLQRGNGLSRSGEGGFEYNTLASNQVFTFTINNPLDPEETEFDPEIFDIHACGQRAEESDIFLQNPVTLNWTSETETINFTGYEIERREEEGEWLSLTDGLEDQALSPLGSYHDYSYTDYSISEAEDFEYRLKSHSSEQISSGVEVNQDPIDFDLGDVEVEDFVASAGSKRCAAKLVSCIRSTINRYGEIDLYAGESCKFEELPGFRSDGECSDGGLFPLCFPFHLYSSGDTLPFTLPFTLSGD